MGNLKDGSGLRLLEVGIEQARRRYAACHVNKVLESVGICHNQLTNRYSGDLPNGRRIEYFPSYNTFMVDTSQSSLQKDIPRAIEGIRLVLPDFYPRYCGLGCEMKYQRSGVLATKYLDERLDGWIESIINYYLKAHKM